MRDRLTLVTSSFPIRGDGSEAAGAFVADLAEELARCIEVQVVAPGPIAGRERWSERIEVYRYASPARPLSTLKPWRLNDLRWIVRVMRGGLNATRAAVDERTAHVLALWGLPCGEWARRVSFERGIRYSVWMLGSDVWSLGRVPFLRGKLARVMREARHAYADGYCLAESAERIGKVPVTFLPSTRRIDLANPCPPRIEPPYRLLFLGRWHPNKGVDLLFDALAILSDADWWHIECVEIQGGGALEKLVRERAITLQAAGRPVKIGHFLAKDEAEAAIARADWILIPSRIESIPVVFSDAMKLGRPVVAMPVGDLPRLIVNQGCGEIATEVSASGFAKALSAALSGSPHTFESGVRNHAARFDLSQIAMDLQRKVFGND